MTVKKEGSLYVCINNSFGRVVQLKQQIAWTEPEQSFLSELYSVKGQQNKQRPATTEYGTVWQGRL